VATVADNITILPMTSSYAISILPPRMCPDEFQYEYGWRRHGSTTVGQYRLRVMFILFAKDAYSYTVSFSHQCKKKRAM